MMTPEELEDMKVFINKVMDKLEENGIAKLYVAYRPPEDAMTDLVTNVAYAFWSRGLTSEEHINLAAEAIKRIFISTAKMVMGIVAQDN